MQLLAIDLAKQVFHVHGVGSNGVVVTKRIRRAKLVAIVAEPNPAMEACSSSHHWGACSQLWARQFV